MPSGINAGGSVAGVHRQAYCTANVGCSVLSGEYRCRCVLSLSSPVRVLANSSLDRFDFF